MKILALYLCAALTGGLILYGAYAVIVAPPPSGGCSMGMCF